MNYAYEVWKYRNEKVHGINKTEEYNNKKQQETKQIKKIWEVKGIGYHSRLTAEFIQKWIWETDNVQYHCQWKLDQVSQNVICFNR